MDATVPRVPRGATSSSFLTHLPHSLTHSLASCADPGPRRRRVDRTGRTALHWACEQGNSKVAEFLVGVGGGEAEADGGRLGHQDVHGETALHRAARWGRRACLHVLLAAGAPHDVLNDRGQSALAVCGNRDGDLPHRTARSAARKVLFERVPSLRVLLLSHADFDLHAPIEDHQESPARLAALVSPGNRPRLRCGGDAIPSIASTLMRY